VILFPNCKINLGLYVIAKRTDGYHDIETIFYSVNLRDGLEAIQNPGQGKEDQLTVTGNRIDGASGDNLCLRAVKLIRQEFPKLPPLHIQLHKLIPAGAGLGGGSADGAFMLQLLNRKFQLGLSAERLLAFALELGSDCPFFVINKPCFARGRGEILEPVNLDLSAYRILLVNPGIHISTAWAFSKIKPEKERPSLKEIIQTPVPSWQGKLLNDFEPHVMAAYPELQKIKDSLYNSGAHYASLTGTGSTIFGLFPEKSSVRLDFPSGYFVKEI
jgi:4-diphosphocytidyl-2-C-methyl-D-erythritol kinase